MVSLDSMDASLCIVNPTPTTIQNVRAVYIFMEKK